MSVFLKVFSRESLIKYVFQFLKVFPKFYQSIVFSSKLIFKLNCFLETWSNALLYHVYV